ncbi:MAG TPA: hypothetical protein VFZ69_14615 [Longimicrobiales bacterium]
MSAWGESMRVSGHLRVLLASIGVVVALLLLLPGRARAGDWKECVDDAFVDYNSCLMNSGGWFDRKLCDLDWEFEVALCTAKAVGEIRNAWNGDAIQ